MSDKRHRVDTAKGAVEVFRNARDVPIPGHMEMSATARMQWDLITRTKPSDAWTATDLELVYELCNTRAQKIEMRSLLPKADDVDMEPQERLKLINQTERAIDVLAKREIALTRLLQIHPHATQGESRDQAKRNKENAKAREAKEGGSSYIKRFQ